MNNYSFDINVRPSDIAGLYDVYDGEENIIALRVRNLDLKRLERDIELLGSPEDFLLDEENDSDWEVPSCEYHPVNYVPEERKVYIKLYPKVVYNDETHLLDDSPEEFAVDIPDKKTDLKWQDLIKMIPAQKKWDASFEKEADFISSMKEGQYY